MVDYVNGSLEIIQRATAAIEQGDVLGLGRCMCEAQVHTYNTCMLCYMCTRYCVYTQITESI